MGGAMLEGWRAAGAFQPQRPYPLRSPPRAIWRDALPPHGRRQASTRPIDGTSATAQTVLLAVKPQLWREAAETYAPHHRAGCAVLVSVAAGVPHRRRFRRRLPTVP